MMSKQTVCIDFDGVIHSYTSPWTHATEIHDPPVPGAFNAIRGYLDAGLEVAIYSSRSSYGEYYWGDGLSDRASEGIAAMENWIRDNGGQDIVYAVKWPLEKPPAMLYIDDRGYTFEGTFPPTEFIKNFTPWNKR
jgi:hypothetical protein